MAHSADPYGSLQGQLILASASLRRHALLGATGLAFEIEAADVDESLRLPVQPEAGAEQLALRKALEVARRHRAENTWVMGADTLVALGQGSEWRLLGKPRTEQEARRMLQDLSGTRHQVVTGVAVVDCRAWTEAGPRAPCVSHERTWVNMRPITEDEVEAYVRSGEWRDKAGGYAIQENADVFVTGLEEGGFDNVVGLPVALSLELLCRSGAFLVP